MVYETLAYNLTYYTNASNIPSAKCVEYCESFQFVHFRNELIFALFLIPFIFYLVKFTKEIIYNEKGLFSKFDYLTNEHSEENRIIIGKALLNIIKYCLIAFMIWIIIQIKWGFLKA